MKKYFLTESRGSIIQGHDFADSRTATDYFAQAQAQLPEAEFVNLTRLNIALAGTDGAETQIILSKYSAQFKDDLSAQYPAAQFSQFDQF